MKFKTSTQGMDELEQKLRSLGNAAKSVAAKALYEGAGVMADSVSQSVRGIATSPFKYAANGEKRKPSPEEKAILETSPKGVSRFKKDATSVQTSVGFNLAGYVSTPWGHARKNVRTNYKVSAEGKVRHATLTKGDNVKPIPVIANAINSGTSFMTKQPFFRKATSTAKNKALQTIEESVERQIDELAKMEG